MYCYSDLEIKVFFGEESYIQIVKMTRLISRIKFCVPIYIVT